MTRDPLKGEEREGKLPGWARETLAALRSRIMQDSATLKEIEAGRAALAGELPVDEAAVVLLLNGGDRIGLPAGTLVSFRVGGGEFDVTVEGEALSLALMQPQHRLVLSPQFSNEVRISSVPRSGAGG